MIVSLMQPYLFPYLGYFQLMAASDVFVVYDDAQFMKGGWINRNRILVDGRPSWITLPVSAASHRLEIRQREYAGGTEARNVFLGRLAQAYRRAPQRVAVMRLVEAIMAEGPNNVAQFNVHALRSVASFLGIRTVFAHSSSIPKDPEVRGVHRVLAVCRAFGATTYLNASGGRDLYEDAMFASRGLQLRFVQSELPPYSHAAPAFVPALSILDVLMHNEARAAVEMMLRYRTVPA